MKVLIQNPDNLLYLESLDRWSAEIKSAFDFGNSDEAIAFCAKHHIAPVQVVLQWEGMACSLILPVVTQQVAGDRERMNRVRKHG